MAKLIRLEYHSHLNITFTGEDYWEAPDDWDDLLPEEQRDVLSEYEQDWLGENVEVYAQVVEVDDVNDYL
jgi:hypothetical protein